MRIPLTKYGWPQVVFYPVIIIALMIAILLGAKSFLQFRVIISIEIVLALILVWSLMFFRDPERSCP